MPMQIYLQFHLLLKAKKLECAFPKLSHLLKYKILLRKVKHKFILFFKICKIIAIINTEIFNFIILANDQPK